MKINNNLNPLKGWGLWFLAALFYAYEFVLRVSPSVIVDDLILEFSAFELSKASLGNLSALYFYAYALTQIPAGILCDRFGTGKLLTIACLITTLGTLSFGSAQNIMMADISRLIIGAGSAFAFVGCLKLASTWIPPKQFPFIVGLTNFFGMVGAILGNQPLAALVIKLGWREAFYMLTLIGFIFTLLLFKMLKKEDEQEIIINKENKKISLLSFPPKFSKQTWLLALYGCLLVAPVATFGELWGVPFFQARFMISKEIASGLIMFIFLGIGVGGPLIGWITTKIPYARTIMFSATCLALAALLTILYGENLSLIQTRALLFFYGLFTSNMLLCFSLISFQNSPQYKGATIGFVNMMIMAGGAAFQPLVGKLLDLSKKANAASLISILPNIIEFRSALMILPICLIIALGLILVIKPRS